MSFHVADLRWSVGGRRIVEGVSFDVRPGEIVGLIGPNGSGKTSLLRLLAGLTRPEAGAITLEGRDIRTIGRKEMARRLAFVEQQASTGLGLTVREVAALGRYPHRTMFSGWSRGDDDAVDRALHRTGLLHKAGERWQTLSGGERQRVHIARALAQTPRELLLDEPTNHLDIQHQIGLLTLVAGLGLTSVIALHDLNHAAMFCDRLVVLRGGRIVAVGPPAEVLTEALLREVFRVEARLLPLPDRPAPQIVYGGALDETRAGAGTAGRDPSR